MFFAKPRGEFVAEHSPSPELGSAMWGGRRPDDVGEPRRLTSVNPPPVNRDDPPNPPRPAAPLLLLSVVLVLAGTVMFLTGLGLLLGIGGVLVGAGVSALTVGLLLGISGDDS